MHNILVTGSNGQLGSEIQELSKSFSQYNFVFATKNKLDITQFDHIKTFLEENKITTIINCAAYTNVDGAEDEEQNAYHINETGVKNLALLAKEKELQFIHISTDYVFDGTNHKPYTEQDATNPQSIYGKSKNKGEIALLKINPQNSLIIRTSWLYSFYGNNFVKTMVRLGKEKESLGVIYDQVGSPTYAKDLATSILQIIPQINNSDVEIFHYSNEGVVSWYDFAKEIMKMAKLKCHIDPIETFEYPTAAPRPHYSLLNKRKIKEHYNIKIAFWKDGLDECLKRLGERK